MKLVTLRRWLPVREAHAHCDIPCGIYDPVSAKIAAQTVLKMVMRIQALKYPKDGSHEQYTAYRNSIGRYITVKEQHADLVKHEVDILWHDYFKPEHLDKYPDLHTTVWETTKLASANKQNVDLDSAKQLVASVDKVAETFWATKGVEYSDTNADVRFGT
jgi:nickel superoxide dismutase